MNSYIREGTSYYRYNSVDDFINGADPIGFGVTYGFNGNDAPGADATFGMGAIYGQDEWSVAPNFKLTYGVRLEKPFYLNKLTDNPAISALTFANGEKMDVGTWPKSKMLVSPRVGFNWDVKGDRSLQIRVDRVCSQAYFPLYGLPTSPPTLVYFRYLKLAGAREMQTSLVLHSILITNNSLLTILLCFQPPRVHYPTVRVWPRSGKNFKFPQIWRSNLATDVELPGNMVFTGEFIYSKDINAITQTNINEAAPTGTLAGSDNRPYWTNSNCFKDKFQLSVMQWN